MSEFENLKNEYLEKINLANNKSRNILIFTDKTKEEIKNSFKKKRINGIEEKEKYVISIKFENAIAESSLQKNFQHYIIFTSFKQNENVIINDDDKRNKFYINVLKKAFDDIGINVDELDKLTSDEFYRNYPPECLNSKIINMINAYYLREMKDYMEKKHENTKWKPFQQTILNKCKEEPEDRPIYIIEDVDKIKNGIKIDSGGIGKSKICDKIVLEYNTIIADGKKDNIFNQIKNLQDKGIYPKVIILDVPRQGKDYILYGVLEQIKNALIYSGKYEGGICHFPIPHMFILTNFRVDISNWSSDRIRFIDIESGEITNTRKPNSEGVCDYDDNYDEEIDYKSKYYELKEKYENLIIKK